jgi:hypothetical protein
MAVFVPRHMVATAMKDRHKDIFMQENSENAVGAKEVGAGRVTR